jgi:hypothetical protein
MEGHVFSKPENVAAQICTHSNKKDLTQGLGTVRNIYCPNCKMHWYKGRSWLLEEWNEYVNDFSGDDSKYFSNCNTSQ